MGIVIYPAVYEPHGEPHRTISAKELHDAVLPILGFGSNTTRIVITPDHVDVTYLCQDRECAETLAALPHIQTGPAKWVEHTERIEYDRG